jgi:hypothetical protein
VSGWLVYFGDAQDKYIGTGGSSKPDFLLFVLRTALFRVLPLSRSHLSSQTVYAASLEKQPVSASPFYRALNSFRKPDGSTRPL